MSPPSPFYVFVKIITVVKGTNVLTKAKCFESSAESQQN